MKKIIILAQKSFCKSFRSRVFFVFFLFAIMLIFLSILLSLLTFTEEIKIIKDVGLAVISIFSSLIAIFLSAEAVVGEIEKKTIYILLSKPTDKKSFLFGSFLGIIWTVGIAILINGGALIFLIYLKQSSVDPGILLALLFMELEVLVITSIGIMFSSLSSSALTSTFLCLFLYLLGHLNPQLIALKKVVQSQITKGFLTLVSVVIPNLELFNIREMVVEGKLINLIYTGKIAFYSLIYSGICLIIAYLLFEKREF